MSRTLRSKKKRYGLWRSTDGKCAICGKDLPDNWEADHIIPWKQTGRTNPFEMQPTCKECNQRKGATTGMFEFDWDACRPGTKEVITTAIDRFGAGHNTQSNNLPTRYGKSPTGRLLGGIATRGWITPSGNIVSPFACTNLWLTHTASLRHQFVSAQKWAEFTKIFSINTELRYGELKALPKNYYKGIRPNNEDFLACTIQLVLANKEVFKDWIDYEQNRTGLPVMVHMDECQLLRDILPWGQTARALIGIGALLVVWTATPSRADGGTIPGFYTEIIDTSFYTSFVKMDEVTIDGVEMIIQGQKENQKTRSIQFADVNIPFSEAWAEGFLCRISHQTFEVDLTKIKNQSGNGEECKLSDLSESYIKNSGVLGRVLRDPVVIAPACEQALKYLRQHRELNPHAAMIVFSESDTAGISNRHAKAIKKALKRLDHFLKIDIATSKSEDDPDILLEQFISNDHDVIIVKDMAGAGWDCKRVKVVLDLSSTRQDASTIQRWTRGATPDGINTVMTLVAPNDVLTRDIFNRWIAEEGGQAIEVVSELVAQFLREKKHKKKELIFASDAASSFFSDNDNQYAPAEQEGVVDALLDAFPWALSQESRAGISKKVRQKNIYIESAAPPALDPIDNRIETLRDSVNSRMDEIHRIIYWNTYNKYHQDKWGETKQACYTELYKRAGIPHENRTIATNRDLNQLWNMKMETERWLKELEDAFN